MSELLSQSGPAPCVEKGALQSVAIPLACAVTVLGTLVACTAPGMLPRKFFFDQDAPVILLLITLLVMTGLALPRWPLLLAALPVSRRTMLVGTACVVLVLWAATYLLFDNYALTRDEQMVVFDTQIFRTLRLSQPLPMEWRHFIVALNPAFLLRVPGHAAWVSDYMPGNAMLRTAFGLLFDPALLNPLLAGVGAIALFDIASKIFPGDRGPQFVSLLLYATSAQVLITALTPYAMTAHLALNLLWLSFYLRRTRTGHLLALVVGFVAIGLHQVIFHPLFALPFIDQLRRQGRWRTALTYLGAYAAFGLFWISYPHIVLASAGIVVPADPHGGGGFFAERVLPLLRSHQPLTIDLMALNLVRFIAWQNLALLPLMAVGFGAIRSDDGIARPLAWGILLTLGAMALLLPFQGHGWGYRYMHGLIGNSVLLAGYGWHAAANRDESKRFLAVATAATICVTLPFLAWQAHRFVHRYAEADRRLGSIKADMAVIEIDGLDFSVDEVRNRPDLQNRPIRLASSALTPSDIPILCSRGSVAFVDVFQMRGIRERDDPLVVSKHFQALRAAAPASCRVS